MALDELTGFKVELLAPVLLREVGYPYRVRRIKLPLQKRTASINHLANLNESPQSEENKITKL